MGKDIGSAGTLPHEGDFLRVTTCRRICGAGKGHV